MAASFLNYEPYFGTQTASSLLLEGIISIYQYWGRAGNGGNAAENGVPK